MTDPTPTPLAELKLGGLKPSHVSFDENGFVMHLDIDQKAKEKLDMLLQTGEWANVLLSTIATTFQSGKSAVRTYTFLGRVVTLERIATGYAVTFHTFGRPEAGSVEV